MGRSLDSDWRGIRVKADRMTTSCCSRGTFFVIGMGRTPSALLKTRWLLVAQRHSADLCGNPMLTRHLAPVTHIYMGLSRGKAATLPFDCLLMAVGMISVGQVSPPCSLCCVPGRRSTWTAKSASKYLNTILGWAVPQNSPGIHFLSSVSSF